MASRRKPKKKLAKLQFMLFVLIAAWVLFFVFQIALIRRVTLTHEHVIIDKSGEDSFQASLQKKWTKPLDKAAVIEKRNPGASKKQSVESSPGLDLVSNDSVTKEEFDRQQRAKTLANEEIDCGCPHVCDDTILDKGTDDHSCRKHIKQIMIDDGLSQQDACQQSSIEIGENISSGSKPCAAECNPKYCTTMEKKKKEEIDCGCPHVCDYRAINKRTPRLICQKRIEILMKTYNIPEENACEAASEDVPFQDSDKPCEIECNPKFCKDMKERPKIDVSNMELHDPPFQRYEGVVIATKVLWPKNIPILKQMFCLLNAAYNRHVNYDVLVFTTLPWTDAQIADLQSVVAPAKLTVALEGPSSLEGYLEEMTKDERRFLEKRCNVTDGETLSWFHHCEEVDTHLKNNLGYAWQAEFRAYHIWKHEALKPYKYMFWMDSDAMATMPFATDPMKVFIENDLNLMFDHFPGGLTRLPAIKDKMVDAYGKSICKVTLNKDDGSLEADMCKEGTKPSIRQVYGFNHITRLDMYRNETHQKFLKSMVSDYKFSRRWDDQLAVTVPAVMEDPKKARDSRAMGVVLGLHHNTFIDGKERGEYYSYLNWWTNVGKTNWTVARSMCDGLVVDLE
jgi:hypothetical protein